jgi:hypothetical protein
MAMEHRPVLQTGRTAEASMGRWNMLANGAAFIVAMTFFVVVASLPCTAAFADGVMIRHVGGAGKMVASPRQEALLVCVDGKIDVTLRTSFRADPTELAWIIPVPRPPDSVQEADDKVFAELEQCTVPLFREVKRGSAIGCGRAQDSSQEIGRITVTKTGKAGIYDYTVLTATGTQVLAKWLNDHGFHTPPGSKEVFQGYVERGWCWLTIRLNSEHSEKDLVAPRPIRYTYRNQQCTYPLIISQLSADDENEIVLYVLGRQPFRCENWAQQTIPRDRLKRDRRSSSGTNYEELFRSLTDTAGGRLFVPEFVGDFTSYAPVAPNCFARLPGSEGKAGADNRTSQWYIARLRAVMAREAMDRDVVLVPTEHPYDSQYEALEVHRVFHLSYDNEVWAGAAAILLLIVSLLGLAYLIHHRWNRWRQRPA